MQPVFVLGLGAVDPGVVDVDADAVLTQGVDDVHHPGVAQIGAVFLEGQAEDEDPAVADADAALRHELDHRLRDVGAHAVVDAPAGEDDLGVVADGDGLVGEALIVKRAGSTPMQWPPTRPGRKGRKFHLLPAASSTSRVSMPSLPKIRASSFIRAMLRSRWVFSMTLAASATRMLLARAGRLAAAVALSQLGAQAGELGVQGFVFPGLAL